MKFKLKDFLNTLLVGSPFVFILCNCNSDQSNSKTPTYKKENYDFKNNTRNETYERKDEIGLQNKLIGKWFVVKEENNYGINTRELENYCKDISNLPAGCLYFFEDSMFFLELDDEGYWKRSFEGSFLYKAKNGEILIYNPSRSSEYKKLFLAFKADTLILSGYQNIEEKSTYFFKDYFVKNEDLAFKVGVDLKREPKEKANTEKQEITTEQEQQEITEETNKKTEIGPIVYDLGEWIKVNNDLYNVEYKVNDAYRKRIGWYDMWIARFGTVDDVRPEDREAMKQRYYDLGIIELEVRGTSSSLEEIDMSDFKIYYPYECSPFLERTLLKMLNGTETTTRNVSSNRSTSFRLPFILYTNVMSSYQAAPEEKFRFGTTLDGGKTLVEAIFE